MTTRSTKFSTPFRLGSTSYIYEADLLPNVERLAAQGEVDDIELVLFELDNGPSNFPDQATVQSMAGVAAAHDITFTVHLPLDLRHDSGSPHPSLRQARRVIEITQPLQPFAYVFHLDGTDVDQPGWLDQALRAVETAIDWVPSPDLLALENLENYAPAHLEPVYAAFPIGRTLDIGHLWKQGTGLDSRSLEDSGNLKRTRVIHLHGCIPGDSGRPTDHVSLARMTPPELDPVLRALAGFHGVLTLEVFGEADFFSSRDALFQSYNRATS